MPHQGMVQDTLDKDRKPVLGPHPFNNEYIKYWFRKWDSTGGGKGDSTVPICFYTTLPYVTKHIPVLRWMIPTVPLAWGDCDAPDSGNGHTGFKDPNRTEFYCQENFVAIDTVHTDTAFKNFKILDTLPFLQVAGTQGVYQYQNGNFYPIGNRGFGAEWNEEHNVRGFGCINNYSFSMEMHRTFVMVPGLYFNFAGDDDTWVFINGKLVVDIGGVHNTVTGGVNLDTMAGLTTYNTYNIDLFYCERHSCGSDILITTNMLLYKPTTNKQRFWQRDYGNLN
jgi:fibro-slime domain-containing protein